MARCRDYPLAEFAARGVAAQAAVDELLDGLTGEKSLVVTPAMRAKAEELVDLVTGNLPGYKIAAISLSVTMEPK